MTDRRKDRAREKLYTAVANFIAANGGSAAVIGGVDVQHWPGESDLTFRLAVKFTGRPPQKNEGDWQRAHNAAILSAGEEG